MIMVQSKAYHRRRKGSHTLLRLATDRNISVCFVLLSLSYILLFSFHYVVIEHYGSVSSKQNHDLLWYKQRIHHSRKKVKEGCRLSIYGCLFFPREWTSQNTKDDIQKFQLWIDSKRNDHNDTTTRNSSAISSFTWYGDQYMGGMTQKGKSHITNQDRGIIVSPFYIKEHSDEQKQKTNNHFLDLLMLPKKHLYDRQYFLHENNFLIAMFDGHGDLGHEVATYLQDNFYKRLADNFSNWNHEEDITTSQHIVKEILKQTFLEMEKELPPIKDKNGYNIGDDGGSTASVILRIGSSIFFANVGDSLSFLATYEKSLDKTTIIQKNRFDKPHLPDEKERIEKMNGKIFIPKHPINSRVNAFYPKRNEVMSLGMSRSIGDNPHTKIGVIAEPIIDVLNIDDLIEKYGPSVNFFVVSSSDGLYDHRKPEFIAAHFAKSFFVDEEYPSIESGKIIDLATPQAKDTKRYFDDITIMALRIVV